MSGPHELLLRTRPGHRDHAQLRAKASAYTEIAVLNDSPRVLLFAFPTPRREAEARRPLDAAGMIVATATRERVMADPLGPVWQPLHHPFRVPLLEILATGARRPEHNRLRELG